MLDLSTIPVVDNHCHPVFLNQRMDALQFRNCFVEGNGPSFPERHLSNSVYYLWLLRQVAAFYGCERTEEAVLATRNSMSTDALLERLLPAANIDTLVIDTGYPPSEERASPSHCSTSSARYSIYRLQIVTTPHG